MTRPGDGERPGDGAPDGLAALAAALNAPGRPSELEGLGAVLAEFRSAGADASSPAPEVGEAPLAGQRSRRRVRRRPLLVGGLAGLLAIAACTNLAQRGSLPDPVQQIAHTMLGGIGVRTPGHAHSHGSKQTAPTGPGVTGPGGSASAATSAESATSAPSPSELLHWCQILAAGQYDLHNKAIDPAVRKKLSDAAGSPGDDSVVVPYCVGLLTQAGKPTGSPPSSAVAPSPSSSQGSSAGDSSMDRHPSPAPPRSTTDRTRRDPTPTR